MQKIFYQSIALLMGVSCLTGISAQAAYSSPEDVAISLRAMSGGYIPEENVHKIYVSPDDLQNYNHLVHFGIFFETDPAIIDIFNINLAMESQSIRFYKDSFKNPTVYAFPEAQEFVHTDGNVYSSRFEPYCFGRINMMNRYEPAAFSCTANIQENNLHLLWIYDYNNQDENGNKDFSARFFGNASDDYHFIEFDMQIDSDTPAGKYPVRFMINQELNSDCTYITSDDSIPDPENEGYYKSIYSKMIPTLYDAEIILTDGHPVSETEITPVFRYAHDQNEFSVQEFPAEISLIADHTSMQIATEDLLEVFDTGSPADMAVSEPITLRSELQYQGVQILSELGNASALEYHIGQKGDADLNGSVDAADAAKILIYAAEDGSGMETSLTGNPDSVEEKFAFFLADIDGEGKENSTLDSEDAAKILIYAAQQGSGQEISWEELS